jgi:hypothetical protein
MDVSQCMRARDMSDLLYTLGEEQNITAQKMSPKRWTRKQLEKRIKRAGCYGSHIGRTLVVDLMEQRKLATSVCWCSTAKIGREMTASRVQLEGREGDLFKRQASPSFRVLRDWLTVNARRGFQIFRKRSWLPTGLINLILIEEGSIFEIGTINQCVLQLSA